MMQPPQTWLSQFLLVADGEIANAGSDLAQDFVIFAHKQTAQRLQTTLVNNFCVYVAGLI